MRCRAAGVDETLCYGDEHRVGARVPILPNWLVVMLVVPAPLCRDMLHGVPPVAPQERRVGTSVFLGSGLGLELGIGVDFSLGIALARARARVALPGARARARARNALVHLGSDSRARST